MSHYIVFTSLQDPLFPLIEAPLHGSHCFSSTIFKLSGFSSSQRCLWNTLLVHRRSYSRCLQVISTFYLTLLPPRPYFLIQLMNKPQYFCYYSRENNIFSEIWGATPSSRSVPTWVWYRSAKKPGYTLCVRGVVGLTMYIIIIKIISWTGGVSSEGYDSCLYALYSSSRDGHFYPRDTDREQNC